MGSRTSCIVFFFNDTSTTEIYTLSLHDALPILGVLLAGLAGLLFSPIAARLRGIYLGVASLSLVFIGQHVLNSWTSVTGGFNGRSAPEFSLFGFTFGNTDPQLFVLGVPFREAEQIGRASCRERV